MRPMAPANINVMKMTTASSDVIPKSVSKGTRCTTTTDIAIQQNITANEIQVTTITGGNRIDVSSFWFREGLDWISLRCGLSRTKRAIGIAKII